MLEKLECEFLYLFWRVAPLVLFLGAPQSREVYDRRKEKLDIVLAASAAVNYAALRHHVKNNPKLSSTTSDRR